MGGPKNILVSNFCQSAGVASALRILFPAAKVRGVPKLGRAENDPASFQRNMEPIDTWINTELGDEYFTRRDLTQAHAKLAYLRVPLVEFDVFHPDLCAVAGEGAGLKYTSRIAAWTYSKSIPPAKAAGYFNHTSFANLGYLSRWDSSVARLKANFDASDLKDDFDWFYRRIKRAGQFMYTQTHPKPFVLAELAKLVAVKLGRDRATLDLDVPADDRLSDFIWPVYPEIARHLSIPTLGYVWKFDDTGPIEGLETYIGKAYDLYRSKGIAPESIEIPGIRMADLGEAIMPYG